MAGISHISNIAPDPNQVNKQSDIKKTTLEHKLKKTAGQTSLSRESDQAEISQAAKELLNLKTEARKYVEQVKASKTASEQELDELKRKLQDNSYFSPEIIDAIVDKLINMPDFFDK